MFTTRRVEVRGRSYDLKWVKKDQYCFDIIEEEWQEYHNNILTHVSADNDKLVLQAGGNCGLYPFYYSFIFDKVITFEPEPLNFNCLVNNCTSNQFIKFNTALGDRCGSIKIGNPDPDNIGMYTIGGGDIEVYVMTIDSLQLNQCSLIHLDVEGYELNVIKGGIDTIKKYKPVIALEISRDKKEIDKLLSSIGYKCVGQYGVQNNNFVYKVE